MQHRATFPISIPRILFASLLFVLASAPVFGYLGPEPPEPNRLWFVLFPQSPIASGAEFAYETHVAIPEELRGTEAPEEVRLIVRNADDMAEVANVPTEHFRGSESISFRASNQYEALGSKALAMLRELPPGRYLCAFMGGQRRLSNVAEFEIDPALEITSLPVLELTSLEAPPYCRLPVVGVRVTGSNALNETFRHSQVSYASYRIDGIDRHPTFEVWGGLDPKIRHGDRLLQIQALDGYYDPIIDPATRHKLQLNLKGYESNTITLRPKRPLAERWDRAREEGGNEGEINH